MIPQIKNTTTRVVDFFLDLIFPKFCLSCAREGAYLCEDCKSRLQFYHHPFCSICKNGIVIPQKCPRKCKSHIKLALSPFSYDNPLIKNLIHNFKYNFIKSLGADLADFMIESFKCSDALSHLANKLSRYPANELIIIPVPLHRRRLAFRGFNQSEILARQISEKLNIKFANALKRIKNTKPQIEMISAKERQENIKNAFVLRRPKKFLSFPPPFLSFPWKRESRFNSGLDPRFRGDDNKWGREALVLDTGNNRNDFENKTVILVDDMLTTGATLEECARVLKQNGAREIWALTIAK